MVKPPDTRGLVLGKFYPPHLGHEYLIRFASQYVDQLLVVVEEIPGESIAVATRLAWLEALFPQLTFLVLADCNPQSPQEHPAFWSIWQASLRRLVPQPIDYVFASESYGEPLARCLNAKFIPLDPQRQRFAVSGSKIRQSLYSQWHFLTQPVQKYFQKHICVCGPESTGKTTLSHWLLQHLNAITPQTCSLIPEYARSYLEYLPTALQQDDMLHIARGQQLSESIDGGAITPLRVCDTGVDASRVWSEFLFGECSEDLANICQQATYDLYLLCKPDVPWVDDGFRYLPNSSEAFYQRIKLLIAEKTTALNIVEIDGPWHARNKRALQACQAVLASLAKPLPTGM